MLEPRSYDIRGVLDVVVGSLLRLHGGPLRHRLNGDMGVSALETC
jgi:hypothetical protein